MPQVKAVIAALTVTPFVVTGFGVALTVEPYARPVPYSNVVVVDAPLALTVPLSVAPVVVIALAAAVVALGAPAGHALVVNVSDALSTAVPLSAWTRN